MLVDRHLRPAVGERRAEALARELYGLEASARELPSERDRNHLLRCAGGERFVLKIHGAAEGEAVLDLQNRAMRHLSEARPPVRCPVPRPTRAGDPMAPVELDGVRHWVRLLSWVPGVPLARVRPHTPELLRALGRFLGRLDRSLQGFAHPAAERPFYWDLARAPDVIRAYVGKVPDPGGRDRVLRLLERHQRHTLPLLDGLRSAVVHHDANDHNVMVHRPEGDPPEIGIIDFGDMVHSRVVFELAVGTAYAMLEKPDPLAAAAEVARGYHEEHPLEEAELAVLLDAVCMRVCMSLCIAAHQRAAEPDNEYLEISEAPNRRLLERLESIPPGLAERTFRRACSLEAVRVDREVRSWLSEHGSTARPVLPFDLSREPAVTFDLSVGSPGLPAGLDPLDAPAFTRHLFRRMDERGARLGLGRYDEVRSLYSTDGFVAGGNDGPEWRTVHLGVDLFAAAGTEVRAPLDGRVAGLRNNAAPLDYGPTVILEHRTGGPTFHTLYGHLSLESLDGLSPGRELRAGERLGWIGDASVNGGWPPHLHFQVITDLLGMEGDFPGVAPHGARRAWLDLCPDPNLLLRIPSLSPAPRGPSKEELIRERRERLSPSLSLSYRRPLHIVRGRGQYLYDETGRRYLDAVNNVPHVGHCHPRVVEALSAQAAVLNTNTRYLHGLPARYARRLCATLPGPLRVCFLVNSGSEANELALRLARAHTRRRDLAVVEGAYHGHTAALIDASPYKFDGPGGEGAPPHVHKVAMPDPYRGPHRGDAAGAGRRHAGELAELARRLEAEGRPLAAFLCEPILGCGGQVVPPDGYLRRAFEVIREAGGVAIADEVQVGFGRVGSHFWAFEAQGAMPDIVTLGKPMGNGHPLGAVVTTREIAASFATGMEYFNTFGGNPVSCAAGLAVLEVLEEEGLQAHALEVGGELRSALEALMPEHPVVGDVRGRGLFLGVELVADRKTREPAAAQASYVVERMRDRGILLSTDGPLRNVIKIKPPLVFDSGDARQLAGTLAAVLSEDAARPGRVEEDR